MKSQPSLLWRCRNSLTVFVILRIHRVQVQLLNIPTILPYFCERPIKSAPDTEQQSTIHNLPIPALIRPYPPDNALFAQVIQMILDPVRSETNLNSQLCTADGWILFQQLQNYLGSFLG